MWIRFCSEAPVTGAQPPGDQGRVTFGPAGPMYLYEGLDGALFCHASRIARRLGVGPMLSTFVDTATDPRLIAFVAVGLAGSVLIAVWPALKKFADNPSH